MRNLSVKFFAVFLVGFLCLTGCTKTNDPEKTAASFLEAYYTHANLDKSKSLTSGLAQQKIDDQIALGGGQKGAGEESKRQVGFSKKENIEGMEKDQTATRKSMLYQIDITRAGSTDEIHLLVRLTLEQEGGQWKVVNFAES